MTVLSAKVDYLDFTPGLFHPTVDINDVYTILERAIIEGSGGPDNVPVTMAGLRFVRHLMCILSVDDFGLPNFKNRDAIIAATRRFIQHTNGPAEALQTMQAVMNSQDFIGDWQ